MKRYYFISSFFLATTCIVGPSPLEAIKLLLDHDKDIAIVGKVGRSKFLEDKAKQRVDAARLSDKGDLQTNTDVTLRRRFYTTGDGDCFFWATDQNRQAGIALLLQHSGDINMRRLAHEEIYDAMMDDIVGERNLRRQLNRVCKLLGPNTPIVGEIKTENLEDARELLKDTIKRKGLSEGIRIHEVGYRPLPRALQANPLYKDFKELLYNLQDRIDETSNDSSNRREFIRRKNVLEQRVKDEYCLSEAIYREYVQHALPRRDQYMLYSQDVGGNTRTYFVDLLARLSNKNLVIWAYDDTRTSLVRAHEFIVSPQAETWEVLHEGIHYTRIVPVDNRAALLQGTNRENEFLAAYSEKAQPITQKLPVQLKPQPIAQKKPPVNPAVKPSLKLVDAATPPATPTSVVKTTQKATPSRAIVKKTTPNRAIARKATPNRAIVKKTTPNRAIARKATPNRAIVRNATPSRAVVRNATLKRAIVKKATPNRAIVKKATPNRAIVKKAALNRAIARKAARRRG